jgi:glutamate dehydrogenase
MTTKNNVGLRSGSTKEKIAQLSSLLSSKTARDAAARDRAETVLASEVANALLEKAPAEFLQIRTIEQLAEIATRCSADCEKFLASATEYLVSLGHVDGLSYLTVVLSDRPFIINTIQEVLRSHHIEASSFLYSMIFLKNGARLSVNYLELPRLTEEAKQALGSNLQHSLAELVIVTDHFSEMLARTETLARFIMEPAHAGSAPEGERQELADFLRWLINGGFVFLGLAEWERDPNSLAKTSHVLISQKPSLGLGLLTPQYQRNACLVEELAPIIQNLVSSPELLSCSKLPTHALAHKHERIDQISIKQFGSDGRLQRIFTILGLFTSQARMQEASSVPLIRRKFQRIVELEQLLPNTHNYKAALNIFDSLPREELIRSSLDELMRELNIIRNSQRTLEPYVSLRPDSASQCMAAVIAIPRNRFDESVRARLQNYLETALGAESDASSYHLGLNSRSLAIIAFNVPVSRSKLERISLQTLTDEIQRLTISWRERLEVALKERYPDMNMFQELMHRYGDVFSPEYRASQTIEDSLHDIRFLETLTSAQPYRISLVTSPGLPTASAQLVLYSLDREITISQFFPILERVGLFVESERAIRLSIQGKGAAFIHRFEVRSAANQALDTKRFEQTVAPGLIEILNGTRENDRLNSLLFSAGLSSKHIALLRTYCAYAWQISGFASREAIQDALINFPEQARLLTDLFSLKFDPSRAESIAERRTKFAAELLTFKVSLRAVTDITKDRILRVFANLIDATVRTNFFSDQSVIAFKIHSAAVEIMPLPKPHFEIFMSGVHLEGIHLRGGKVARGGIRWSDRKEDYRYEVLGLMKTQKIKNALIVPTGAKGGFIIKRAIRVDEQPAQVAEEVYKDFIRSLLSLTDNRIGETIVHPKGLIIYDELDPYLVVAADKGTATFSDTANRIAVEEFDFWLGDAFASGGSNGYDHKKYAITARGGWEAVKRHFNDMGRDIEHESFTAIGIGDMSGDVFGNGLLLSRTIKLLAAFNHAHIFVDPNPDPEISFTERKRMFEKPRSQWTDYNRALLSKGGNIFNRLDKEIEITPKYAPRYILMLPYPRP